MNRKLGFATFVFAVILVTAGRGQIFLNGIAQNGATIQGTINGATPGDIITILPPFPQTTVTYFENITITKDIELRAPLGPSSVTIDGQLLGRVITISGGTSVQCIVDGFTITNGLGPAPGGGGIGVFASDATIVNNVLTANFAPNGGGIYLEASNSVIEMNAFVANAADNHGGGIDCNLGSMASIASNEFLENLALHGGGMSCREGSDASTTANLFESNWAQIDGGAVFIADCAAIVNRSNIINNGRATFGSVTRLGGAVAARPETFSFPTMPTISRNEVKGNVAMDMGGGIYLEDADASVVRNQIYRNGIVDSATLDFTDFGGGIAAVRGTSSFDSNGVKQNRAQFDGGGIYCDSIGVTSRISNTFVWDNRCASGGRGGGLFLLECAPQIANNSFVLNRASGGGRAVFTSVTVVPPGGSLTVWNSIMYANAGVSVFGHATGTVMPTASYCLVSPFTATFVDRIFGGVSTNIFGVSPMLVNETTGDLHLTPGSFCIDSGSPNFDLPPFGLQPIDYDQGARVVNGTVDIGADEL